MDPVIAAPPSRNSPCPCGSGLRYKVCHGSLGAAPPGTPSGGPVRSSYRAPVTEWSHLDDAACDACGALMEAALSHQTAGRVDEAALAYREVLARAPNTHDALHMLGVIELGRADLDEAERLIRAALALRPAYPAIEHNLQLVGDARIARMRAQPEALAERALPILSELALAGPDRGTSRPPVRRSVSTECHLIGRVGDDDDDAWLLRRLCEVLGPERLSVWTTDAHAPVAIAGAPVRAIDGAIGALPKGGVHVYVGLDFECAEWVGRAPADRVIVIAIGAAPSLCLDQLRAIAHDGARRVELALASPSMAARFGRGHHVIASPFELVEPIVPACETPIYDEWTIEEPPAWPVGIRGQNRRSVAEPRDIAFVRSVADVAGRVHVHDPGRMRYALGADRRFQFIARNERSLGKFLSLLRCYVHAPEPWWEEGAGRELFAAMALGLPVLCPRASSHADYIDDGVDGALYGSVDEARHCLKDLRRAPALADAMGRAARAKARRLFDPSAVACAWREVVHGAAQPASAAAPFVPSLRVAS